MAAKYLLVPLDGFPPSEMALAEARQLANALSMDIVLLRVVPPSDDAPGSGATGVLVDDVTAHRCDAALKYLDSIRSRDFAGQRIELVVKQGSPADAILEVARTMDVDRIVMTTHGRKGVSRLVLGNVAEKVLRTADRIVVLVRTPPTNEP